MRLPGRPARDVIEVIQTAVLIRTAAAAAQIPCRGYQLWKFFEGGRNNSSSGKKLKWYRYVGLSVTPSEPIVRLMAQRLNADWLLELYLSPFWKALVASEPSSAHWRRIYDSMPEHIAKHIFINPLSSPSQRIRKAPSLSDVESLMMIGGLNATACIIAMMRDGTIPPPHFLYQEVEIMLYNLLVWCCLGGPLHSYSSALYEHVVKYVIYQDRTNFIRQELWNGSGIFNCAILTHQKSVSRAEDLKLINTKKERQEFLYWNWKGDPYKIMKEMGEALDKNNYQPPKGGHGLRWLINKLNETRSEKDKIEPALRSDYPWLSKSFK